MQHCMVELEDQEGASSVMAVIRSEREVLESNVPESNPQSIPGMAPSQPAGNASREEAFCLMMDAADEYLQLHQELSEAIKSGLFNMTRARYSLGPAGISSRQYPARMMATARVHIFLTPPQLELSSDLASAPGNPCAASQQHDSQQNSPDAGGYSSSLIAELASKYTTSEEHQQIPAAQQLQQPLRWFGMTHSQYLLQSQAQFQGALKIVVQMANISNRIMKLSSLELSRGSDTECKTED